MDDAARMILPWQTTQWQQISRAKKENRLAHAFLFTGIAGLGKVQFAENMIQYLLCDQHEIPRCHTCHLIKTKVHPNVLWVEPEEAGHAIKVDQVRALNEFVQQTSLQDGYRVIVIHPANQMNMQATNALLKTLEEPARDAILILIQDVMGQLPATIISRCQRLHFFTPQRADALAWLATQTESLHDFNLLLNLSHGAPLAALECIQSPRLNERERLYQLFFDIKREESHLVQAASQIEKMESMQLLNDIQSLILDLLRLQTGAASHGIINQDYLLPLTSYASQIKMKNTVRFLSYLQQIKRYLLSGINLNKLLMIENIFIRWRLC
jgi:DNA polymerase-3 subunit delta'